MRAWTSSRSTPPCAAAVPGYVGMMGSRRKVARVLDELAAEGHARDLLKPRSTRPSAWTSARKVTGGDRGEHRGGGAAVQRTGRGTGGEQHARRLKAARLRSSYQERDPGVATDVSP